MTSNKAKTLACEFYNEANAVCDGNADTETLACSLETAACVIDEMAEKLRRASKHATMHATATRCAEKLVRCYEDTILDALACLRYGRAWEALQVLTSMEEVINED